MDPRKTVRRDVFLLVVLLVIQHLAAADISQTDPDMGQPAKVNTTHASAPKSDKTKTDSVKANSVVAQVVENTTAALRKMENVRIDDIDKNYASITITDCPARTPGGQSLCNGDVMTLAVNDALRPELKAFHKSDHLKINTDDKNVLSIGIRSVTVNSYLRGLVLGATLALCFLFTTLVTRGHPLKLIIGQDGRYSNSKFQMGVWCWVVISTYLAVVYLRVSQAGWDFFDIIKYTPKPTLTLWHERLNLWWCKGHYHRQGERRSRRRPCEPQRPRWRTCQFLDGSCPE